MLFPLNFLFILSILSIKWNVLHSMNRYEYQASIKISLRCFFRGIFIWSDKERTKQIIIPFFSRLHKQKRAHSKSKNRNRDPLIKKSILIRFIINIEILSQHMLLRYTLNTIITRLCKCIFNYSEFGIKFITL